jgi:hypothetical protein
MTGYGVRLGAVLAVAGAVLVPGSARAESIRVEYVAERTTTSAAALHIDATSTDTSRTGRGMVSFLALRAGAVRGTFQVTPLRLLQGGGSMSPEVAVSGNSAGCGDACSAVATRSVGSVMLDIRDHGGAGVVTRVLIAFDRNPQSVRIQSSRGWRIRRIAPRFTTVDATQARAVGVEAGAFGVEGFVSLDLSVPYRAAAAVARVPCATGDDIPGFVPRLVNGDASVPVSCRDGGTAALVGGAGTWTLTGPAIGSRFDGSTRLIVFAL